MTISRAFVACFLLAASLIATACGSNASRPGGDAPESSASAGDTAPVEASHDDGHGLPPAVASTAPESDAGESAQPVTVTLSEFKFESSLTSFKSGQPYRFTIHNAGTISHELAILPMEGEGMDHPGGHDPAREHAAATATAMGGGSMTMKHDQAVLIVMGDELPPGATIERQAVFDRAGAFEFQCHLPGHLDAGMHLAVKAE